MPDEPQVITPEGKAKAEAELAELRDVRRPAIVAAIKSAREEGDLSENAEYHAAREEQGHNEARIRVIENYLKHAVVQEPEAQANGGRIAVGSTVSFRDVATGDVKTVTLVHPLEASVADGRISVESPIAKALAAGSKGETVTAQAGRGDKQLEILDVS